MTRTIFTEEPGAGKLACPVLKTNGNREGVVEFNSRHPGSVGDGGLIDALLNEAATGFKTQGGYHLQGAIEQLRRLYQAIDEGRIDLNIEANFNAANELNERLNDAIDQAFNSDKFPDSIKIKLQNLRESTPRRDLRQKQDQEQEAKERELEQKEQQEEQRLEEKNELDDDSADSEINPDVVKRFENIDEEADGPPEPVDPPLDPVAPPLPDRLNLEMRVVGTLLVMSVVVA